MDSVRLVAADGWSCEVPATCARASEMIATLLDGRGSFRESEDGAVTFPHLSSPCVRALAKHLLAQGGETEALLGISETDEKHI